MTARSLFKNAAVLLALTSAPAAAQVPQGSDDRWLPWLGCWRAEGDAAANFLCIVPAGTGVRLAQVADGAVKSESRIVADGVGRPVSQEGCSGQEQASWSADGRRLFLSSTQACGARTSRTVTGMMAMVTPSRWVSVQGVNAGGGIPTATRVVQYSAVEPTTLPDAIARALPNNRLARETARVTAAARIQLDDVREAIAQADPTVVETWITATGQTFDLDGKTLIALADAGVPPSVLDALVAVSNPKHFDVQTPTGLATAEPSDRPVDRYDRCRGYWYDPFFYDPYRCGYGYGYGRYGYYGYSPFGYDYYRWGYTSTPIIVIRDDTSPRPHGRVTRQGYRNPGASGSSSNTGSMGSSKANGTTSSGGSTTSSGSSSSSGSSTTRTAKPRTGGH